MTDTQREIKFRIWDKQLKVFLYQLPEKHHLDWERFNVQQFAGLSDRLGKEIYEGDIVLVCFNDGSIYDHPQHVYFEKGSFCVGMGYLSDSKIIEVIGDIYENPELTKKD